jgi:hypothetical protein
MNRDRLLQLADHLDYNVNDTNWDYSTLISPCGTAGCALGHCPEIWPDYWQLHLNSYSAYQLAGSHFSIEISASKFFNISMEDVDMLFFQGSHMRLSKDVIVARIRDYVASQDDLTLMGHLVNEY